MIKKINNKDIEISKKIYNIFQKSYKIEAKILNVSKFPPLERSIENIINSDTLFFGFFIKKKIVSIIETENNFQSIHIQSLVVCPNYFRQGIGKKMINKIIKDTSKNITVETGLKNHPARSLYEFLGFKKNRIYKARYGIKKIRYELKS